MSTEQAPASTDTAPQGNPFAGNPQPAPVSDFKVPEAYAGKPWVEKIKSNDDVWKTLDNAQTLIGKKTNVLPGEGATDEDWNNFYKTIGRPDESKSYALSAVDGIPEGFDLKPYQEKAQELFHQAGLNPRQADAMWKLYMQTELSEAQKTGQAYKDEQARLDKEFDEVVKTEFGDKYDSASKTAQDMINRFVPEQLRGAYSEVAEHPKALAAVIKALEGAHTEIERVKREYGAEGSLSSGDQSSTQSAADVLQELTNKRIEAKKIGAGPKYNQLMEEIDALDKRHRTMLPK